MRNKIDVKQGDRYGYLTIIEEILDSKPRKFLVVCDCGNKKVVNLNSLRTGNVKSCGCKKGFKHGGSRTRLYSIWRGMKKRCYIEKTSKYEIYGGKGIGICDEWRNDFGLFQEWAKNNGYADDLTLDRINSSNSYEPSNCRWVDYKTQSSNCSLSKRNKTGYTGIFAYGDKWGAKINVDYKNHYIGYFLTKKEAVEARNKYIEDNNLPHTKQLYKGD